MVEKTALTAQSGHSREASSGVGLDGMRAQLFAEGINLEVSPSNRHMSRVERGVTR